MNKSLNLPCLRGRMGDWMYYVTVLPFSEIAARSMLATDLNPNKKLSSWIQRQLTDRTEDIVEYLANQPQRFFNAIILGIYGGDPQWRELSISEATLSEEEVGYLERTFGVLTLNGDERMFAIDGQHRTLAIKEVVEQEPSLRGEEVTAIFIAHHDTPEGRVRSRRLFTTLNRYAKPVSRSEVIALDEEDNAAIITRRLMEETEWLSEKVLYSKNKSLPPTNTKALTNIIVLYELVLILLTDYTPFVNVKSGGYKLKPFTSRRQSEEELESMKASILEQLLSVREGIPTLKSFFESGYVDREALSSSLIFRPMGQIILFSTLKIAKQHGKYEEAMQYFAQDDFNRLNPIWQKILCNEDGQTLRTEPRYQRYSFKLILKHLGIKMDFTSRELELHINLGEPDLDRQS